MGKFLEELKDNEELRDNFLAQNTMDMAYEVAKPYLEENFSEDDFNTEMIRLAKDIVEKDGLSDEMLESVQGGTEEQKGIIQRAMVAEAAARGDFKKFV